MKTSDVVTDDTVMAMVQQETEATYGARQAFRSHDGQNAGPDFTFPTTEEDFDGAMTEIPPGSEYPRFEKEYGDERAVYTRYGFEFAIHDDAIDDAVIDVRLDQMQDAIREETRRLDAIAYGVLSANTNDSITNPANVNDRLSFNDVVDSRAAMKDAEFDPDLLLVEPLGAADILKDDVFKLRDTPVGDRAITDGFIGAVAGLDIFEMTAGNLGAHNGIMVDTSKYGYESTKDNSGVDSYREESRDQMVWKISDRLDWVSTNSDAALLIEG
jgi:hypothetical protein